MSKKGPSKKTEKKKEEKIVKDSTFGMKNKNKSKIVQKQIEGIRSSITGGMTKEKRKEEEEKEKKRLEKLQEKMREKELALLFKSLDPKDKKEDDEEEKKVETVEELSEQIDEEIKDESEMTLEEIVEKERAKILEGTKVTLESFVKWKEFKKQQKEKEEERKKKLQEQSFKKSGTGISGKALFEINANLFIDDEDAADLDEYKVNEEVSIDDDLFLDETIEVDENPNSKTFTEKKKEEEEVINAPEYNPDTWKEKKLPKQLLLEFLQQKLKIPDKDLPIFSGGEGTNVKVTLPHCGKELVNKKPYKQKKVAEHNAALLCLTWLEMQEKKEKK